MSEKRWNEHTEQNVEIHDHEKHTGWGDLSDERRKQIEVRLLVVFSNIFGH